MPIETTLEAPQETISPDRPETLASLVRQSPLVISANWQTYLDMERALQDTGIRVRYLKPLLEIMSPISRDHEGKKTHYACLLEAWCLEQDIELFGLGSSTLKQEDVAAGEPDESYCIGTLKDRPDLVVEIALTSGGLSKRAFYARFEVPEIWIWRKGNLEVHLFENGEYKLANESRALPGIDLKSLSECAALGSITQAVKAFRESW